MVPDEEESSFPSAGYDRIGGGEFGPFGGLPFGHLNPVVLGRSQAWWLWLGWASGLPPLYDGPIAPPLSH